MKTPYWETLSIFKKPLAGKDIILKEVTSPIPNELEEIVKLDWRSQLETKQKALSVQKSNLSIRPYKKSGLSALYEGDKPIMWPGPTISLTDVKEEKGKCVLSVFQTSFPFISALNKPEVKTILEKHNIGLVRPALAVSTFALTSDKQLVLTMRGPKTTMYPGRVYGQGGNPLYISENLVSHQENEIKDEILVDPSELISNTFYFGGVVVDKHQLMNKPDLVGWVSLKISSKEIRKRISSRPYEKRPADSVGVIFLPSDKEGLYDFLINKSNIFQYNPPTHAALLLYGYHHFGESWSKRLLKELPL